MHKLLTAAELERIQEAAWALHPAQRAAFEHHGARALAAPPRAAPGMLHRLDVGTETRSAATHSA